MPVSYERGTPASKPGSARVVLGTAKTQAGKLLLTKISGEKIFRLSVRESTESTQFDQTLKGGGPTAKPRIKAHRLLDHSSSGLRVIVKTKRKNIKRKEKQNKKIKQTKKIENRTRRSRGGTCRAETIVNTERFLFADRTLGTNSRAKRGQLLLLLYYSEA